MKRTIPLLLSAVGLSLLVGCNSEVDLLKKHLRKANKGLATCQEDLRGAQADAMKLREERDNARGLVADRDKEIAQLSDANTRLDNTLRDAKKRIQALLNDTDLPPIDHIPVPADVDRALKQFAAANPNLVEYLSRYGMVKFKADLTFAKGKTTVRPAAAAALAKFVEIINGAQARKFHVYVAGHTDDIPISLPATKRKHPNNWYLSAHRAVKVQGELQKAGLAPGRIGVMGFAEHHPVAPNAPRKRGNKLNRRVEIWIVPPDRFLTSPAIAGAAAPPVVEPEK